MGKTNDVLFSKFHFYIAAQMDRMVIYVLVIGRKKLMFYISSNFGRSLQNVKIRDKLSTQSFPRPSSNH